MSKSSNRAGAKPASAMPRLNGKPDMFEPGVAYLGVLQNVRQDEEGVHADLLDTNPDNGWGPGEKGYFTCRPGDVGFKELVLALADNKAEVRDVLVTFGDYLGGADGTSCREVVAYRFLTEDEVKAIWEQREGDSFPTVGKSK